jgi:hypothetical protein
MSSFRILSVDSNAKLVKSAEFGFLSVGLSLAQAKTSGFEVCPWRSLGCTAVCVATSGLASVYRGISLARRKKTRRLFTHTDEFLSRMAVEVAKADSLAESLGLSLHLRLNVFSDLDWRTDARFRHSSGWSIFDKIAELRRIVTVCDYTKDYGRAVRELKSGAESGVAWRNIFSRSENNESQCIEFLAMGGKVAVPFLKQLPKYWHGGEVVNGDIHDLQFLHKPGAVIGLKAKGKARKCPGEFIVNPDMTTNQLYQLAFV